MRVHVHAFMPQIFTANAFFSVPEASKNCWIAIIDRDMPKEESLRIEHTLKRVQNWLDPSQPAALQQSLSMAAAAAALPVTPPPWPLHLCAAVLLLNALEPGAINGSTHPCPTMSSLHDNISKHSQPLNKRAQLALLYLIRKAKSDTAAQVLWCPSAALMISLNGLPARVAPPCWQFFDPASHTLKIEKHSSTRPLLLSGRGLTLTVGGGGWHPRLLPSTAENFSSGTKVKFIKRARNWRLILHKLFFASDPPPLWYRSRSSLSRGLASVRTSPPTAL